MVPRPVLAGSSQAKAADGCEQHRTYSFGEEDTVRKKQVKPNVLWRGACSSPYPGQAPCLCCVGVSLCTPCRTSGNGPFPCLGLIMFQQAPIFSCFSFFSCGIGQSKPTANTLPYIEFCRREISLFFLKDLKMLCRRFHVSQLKCSRLFRCNSRWREETLPREIRQGSLHFYISLHGPTLAEGLPSALQGGLQVDASPRSTWSCCCTASCRRRWVLPYPVAS